MNGPGVPLLCSLIHLAQFFVLSLDSPLCFHSAASGFNYISHDLLLISDLFFPRRHYVSIIFGIKEFQIKQALFIAVDSHKEVKDPLNLSFQQAELSHWETVGLAAPTSSW